MEEARFMVAWNEHFDKVPAHKTAEGCLSFAMQNLNLFRSFTSWRAIFLGKLTFMSLYNHGLIEPNDIVECMNALDASLAKTILK